MSGTPANVAPETPRAQGTPLQTWLSGWLDYLSEHLPLIFLVVAVLVGILVLARGGVKQTLMFAAGAVVAFLLLTNLEAVADFLRNELPLPPGGDAPASGDATAPATPEP